MSNSDRVVIKCSDIPAPAGGAGRSRPTQPGIPPYLTAPFEKIKSQLGIETELSRASSYSNSSSVSITSLSLSLSVR